MEMTPNKTEQQRGALWRKWDLHVHSPASANFSGDWPSFIIQLGNSDCAVIGINDYFSVAGYRQLVAKLGDPAELSNGNEAYRTALTKLNTKTLLPVVECRMTNIVIGKKANAGPRTNFHLIFSDILNPEDIETFIKSLKVKGASIGSRYSDSKFLLDDVAVDFNEVVGALRNDLTFKGKFLVWIPYDEYGGIGDIDPKTDKLFKEGLVYGADILGSGNKKQADFFLWKDPAFSQEDYKAWFGRKKPCIKGSDSHNANDEVGRLKDHNSKPTDRHCWIKADPTFHGLQQIINEPEHRVFIGKVPPKLDVVKTHKTQFLSRVIISKTAGSNLPDTWFDCDIELNHDMVAIIGNKGSGKSALADILALAGSTTRHPDFSFLGKQKFRAKKLASNFEVVTHWADGTVTAPHNLQDNPDPNRLETIKYIPQTYLETICTETSVDERSAFQQELRKVIFSHIAESARLKKKTLDELIEYKTEEISDELAQHREALAQVNVTLANLQHKATADYRAQLDLALAAKQNELLSHESIKPAEVPQPGSLGQEQQAAYALVEAALKEKTGAVEALADAIKAEQELQKTLLEQSAAVTKLESRLTNIENEVKSQLQQSAPQFVALALEPAGIVLLTINRAPLNDKKTQVEDAQKKVNAALSATAPTGLIGQHKSATQELTKLQDQLDAPNKAYQTYLQQLKLWEQGKQKITGDASTDGTIENLKAQLTYLEQQLATDISDAKAERTATAQKVYQCIANIRDVYAELFAPVQQLIQDSVIIKEGYKLAFDSSIIQRGFGREFFERYISQGVNGSFCGKEAGEQRLNSLLEDVDFNDPEQALAFATTVEEHLWADHRTAQKAPMALDSQLRKHAGVKELYDFLWSFEYLLPEYSLKLDGKDLTQLSPGERGSLLLVFYLLVDKSSMPIIVDQPEENLDNQTVYHLLIPVIRDVKRRRQIIMVTHNPNIAVVCDAEQIIHAAIDRSQGQRIVYKSGAIENPVINRFVLDVLEGTRPAFDNRGGKYHDDVLVVSGSGTEPGASG